TLESQLHVLGVIQAPAVVGLSDALPGALVGFQVEILVFATGACQETLTQTVIGFIIDHEQELEATVVGESVFVSTTDFPVVDVIVGELAFEAWKAHARRNDLSIQINRMSKVAVEGFELDAIAF